MGAGARGALSDPRHPQHGGARDASCAEIGEGIIGTAEWILRRRDGDAMASREREELAGIVAGIGGHRAQLAFEEQMPLIVQHRNVAEIDARDGQRAATVERLEGRQHQIADRREQNGGVQLHRRAFVGTLRRRRAQRER